MDTQEKVSILGRVSLRKKLYALYERMEQLEPTSEEYALLLDRVMKIHAVLNDNRDSFSKRVQAVGTLALGAAGLALAYRNDNSEHPTTNKETKTRLSDWLRPGR